MANKSISIEARVAYPREASPGSTYLMSVDLDHALTPEEWPYEDEEYPVTCFLDVSPYFDQEPEGDSTIIVHRFGGSYGPARFWLTARNPPESDQAASAYRPRIQMMLVNGAGIPIHTRIFDDISIIGRSTLPAVTPKPDMVTRQRKPSDAPP